jgi:hypothetical protein
MFPEFIVELKVKPIPASPVRPPWNVTKPVPFIVMVLLAEPKDTDAVAAKEKVGDAIPPPALTPPMLKSPPMFIPVAA